MIGTAREKQLSHCCFIPEEGEITDQVPLTKTHNNRKADLSFLNKKKKNILLSEALRIRSNIITLSSVNQVVEKIFLSLTESIRVTTCNIIIQKN